jgi:HK97 family phage prohead protease
MKTREVRFLRGAQLRATESDGSMSIEGYAAVFNEEYDSGYFIETVKPGAFSKVLASNPDVRALFNHNPDHLLGRTKNGTLKLTQDSAGLRFVNTMPDTQKAKDVHQMVKRGDIDGCSFSFVPSKTTWREEKDPNDPKRTLYYRDIEEFDEVFDVGPVTFPAYTGTSVGARQLWPAGIPAEIRSHVPGVRSGDEDEPEVHECGCRCRACYSAECNECEMHMASCGDGANCGHTDDGSGHERASTKKTKRVDGEDLPSSSFLYVGDPEKTATWSLPWKFSTEEKTKSHLRNALARFNQTSNIPADEKPKVWKKLVAKCKKYGIHVTDDESKSFCLTAEQRKQIGSGDDCECSCPECQVGNHSECSDADCDDPNCQHDDTEQDSDRARLRVHQHLADVETDF